MNLAGGGVGVPKTGCVTPMASDLLWSLLRQSGPRVPRSSALGQMLWALAILVGGILGGHEIGLPPWGLGVLSVAAVVVVANFVGLNWYLAIRNPDALRSERFALTKLAMERDGWRGDDLIVFIRAIGEDEAEGRPPGKGVRGARPRKDATPGPAPDH